MFNIKPDQVRVVLIVSKDYEDFFLSFLFDLGYSWIERDFESLSKRLETIGTILLREDDPRLLKVFEKFYDTSGIIYYFIGSIKMFQTHTVDPFIHGIYTKKDQWKDFNSLYKNLYGLSFNDHLKELK